MGRTVGAATKAHRGVLHIDELQEMDREVIDSLRSVMQDGVATVVRQGTVVHHQARCWVLATMNPCLSGWHGLYQCSTCGQGYPSEGRCRQCGGEAERRCNCSPAQVGRVHARISGPMRDRFDVRIEVPPPTCEREPGKSSLELRKAVVTARVLMGRQLNGRELAEVPGYELADRFSAIADGIQETIPRSSLRRKHRTLKLTLCLAAIDGQTTPEPEHVLEACRWSVGD